MNLLVFAVVLVKQNNFENVLNIIIFVGIQIVIVRLFGLRFGVPFTLPTELLVLLNLACRFVLLFVWLSGSRFRGCSCIWKVIGVYWEGSMPYGLKMCYLAYL